MSTVIYNAYRFKSNRASAVEKNNTHIRKVMSERLKSSLYKKMTELFIEYKFYLLSNPEKLNCIDTVHEFFDYNNFEASKDQLAFLKNRINDQIYSDTKFDKIFIEMTKEATKFNLNLDFNHKLTIYFRTVGEYTYYIFTSNDSKILHEFRTNFDFYMPENFKTYDYWNNTDGLDDISEAAWNGRGKKWDKVFSYKISDDMNKIDIEIGFHHFTEYQHCIEHVPDDFSLFKLYYNEVKSEIYFEEESAKMFKETGKKNDNATYRETVNRIRRDLVDGTANSAYSEFESSDFTRDKILNSLFYEKIKKSIDNPT